MKTITLLFLTFFLFACEFKWPKVKTQKERIAYIQMPGKNDSLCIENIERAKTDIKNGKIVFCMPWEMLSRNLRNEKQIIQLCKKRNFVFEYELFSDVIKYGQTQGCYGAYMDKFIAEKFGSNFKEKLLVQADSILLSSNDTISYYQCDNQLQILGNDIESVLEVKLNNKLSKQIKPDNIGNLPYMYIGFYIDKIGKPSGYRLIYFADDDNKSNEKLKNELYQAGLKELKLYKHWTPGQVRGQKINTLNQVKVKFKITQEDKIF